VVGVPSLYTIWGNRLAPWLAERYLARTAVGSQQADRRTSASRIDNLFEAPPGDPRAHGPYDDMAHARSVQLWATTHRSILLTAALAASAGAAGGSVARALREWARDRW
jgi:hypothetical protein